MRREEQNLKYKEYDYERNLEPAIKKRPRLADVLNSNEVNWMQRCKSTTDARRFKFKLPRRAVCTRRLPLQTRIQILRVTIMASVGVANLMSNSTTVRRRLTTCWVYSRGRLCASLSVFLSLILSRATSLFLSLSTARYGERYHASNPVGNHARDSFEGSAFPWRTGTLSRVSSQIFLCLPVSCSRRTAIGTIRRSQAAIVITCLCTLSSSMTTISPSCSFLSRTGLRFSLNFWTTHVYVPPITDTTRDRVTVSRTIKDRSNISDETTRSNNSYYRQYYEHVTTSRWPISNCGGERRIRVRHSLRPCSAISADHVTHCSQVQLCAVERDGDRFARATFPGQMLSRCFCVFSRWFTW